MELIRPIFFLVNNNWLTYIGYSSTHVTRA